ncbi:MAG: hypothetical protein JWM80_3311 [Cyanobacteria bacterium RYN_339]|nr:hypothetical protein [Cyanobacteria bacterium RYN_339]
MEDRPLDERVRALETEVRRLRAERDRTFTLLDRAGIGASHLTADGRIASANAALARFLGYEAHEMAGMPIEVFTETEAAQLQRAAIADLLAGRRESFDFEKHYVTKEGRRKWGHVYLMSARFDADEPDFLMAIVVDIDPRKQAEETVVRQNVELERGTKLLASVIENMPAGIVYFDREQRIRLINPAARQDLGGPSPEMLIGRTPGELFPDYAGLFASILGPCLERGETYQGRDLQLPQSIPIGGTGFADVAVVPISSPEGGIVGALFMAVESTDRVEKERWQAETIERLRELDRSKDEFLGVLSHELRTPLNGIMGFTSLLADGVVGELDSRQADFLAKIEASTDRMVDLVDDLLDMSRVLLGKLDLLPEAIDLDEVVHQAVARLAPEAEKKGIELEDRVPSELPPVWADAQRVDQVLRDLLGNAIKFTSTGGKIGVSASIQDGSLRCEVADTGVGIAPDALPYVFDRFYQADSSSTRVAGGLGLGLALVKSLVLAQGGLVGVQSEPGKGSTFWFTLPQCAPILAAAPPAT